jgi:hypothetical protein
MTIPAPTPSPLECRFAVYSKSKTDDTDMHLIKEAVHNPDGTITPHVRMVKQYTRNFYVTKKGMQNHVDRKEWELKSNLTEFKCTQTNLVNSVARAFGNAGFRGTLRDLPESRFVYGSDITSTAMIKQSYKDRWDLLTPYSYAVFDTETDMLHGTDAIMMATVSFKDRVFTAVQKSFVAGYTDPIGRIHALAEKYLGTTFKARNIKMEVVLVNTEIDVVRATMAKSHAWKPDFLGVWNLDFDMTKVIEACERAGIAPEDLLCDPGVPTKYRNFRYKRGLAKKVSSSGKVMSFTPAQRWHTVFCPSSFYWIDAMCAYRQVRTGQSEEPSYALDAILNKDLKIGKLKFKEADAYKGAEWHIFMQKNYPLEYVVYNQFDCISMELLDELNLDLQLSLPAFSGCSDFNNFNSQPRRSVNALHYFLLKHDHVIGSTASEMTDDLDTDTLGIDKWIN